MAVEKTNSSSSLAEVIDRILDKGIVIDAWARVYLVGIELLAIEARVVIATKLSVNWEKGDSDKLSWPAIASYPIKIAV